MLKMSARWLGALTIACLTAGCTITGSTPSPGANAPAVNAAVPRTVLPSPDVWGGQARCTAAGCRWLGVEHEQSQVALYRLEGRRAALMDRVPVAYHPDSARWLDDRHAVAAVETSKSLDIFAVAEQGKLRLVQRIDVKFEPRDVHVIPARDGGWLMVATPYRGDRVAWVYWKEGVEPRTHFQAWCGTPWHVSDTPAGAKGEAGLLTSCRDDRRVLHMPRPQTWEEVKTLQPRVVRTFDHIPREVRASPSGRYWYVALELGGRVARYDTARDTWQLMPFTEFGAVGIAPLTDDTVAWGENERVLLQRYDDEGRVIAEKSLPVSGFPTGLQWIDLDGDGHLDLVVMNSAGPAVDVLWGPLAP